MCEAETNLTSSVWASASLGELQDHLPGSPVPCLCGQVRGPAHLLPAPRACHAHSTPTGGVVSGTSLLSGPHGRLPHSGLFVPSAPISEAAGKVGLPHLSVSVAHAPLPGGIFVGFESTDKSGQLSPLHCPLRPMDTVFPGVCLHCNSSGRGAVFPSVDATRYNYFAVACVWVSVVNVPFCCQYVKYGGFVFIVLNPGTSQTALGLTLSPMLSVPSAKGHCVWCSGTGPSVPRELP